MSPSWSRGVIAGVLVLFFLGVVIGAAIAVEPSTTTTKHYLTPFYRASMTNSVNYTYTLSIDAPDGVSTIKSAIVTVDAWISPTITFYAWVNGVACRTSNYTISTTYAGAGRGTALFDCTNAITTTGDHTVTIRPVGQNTGSVTVHADLTIVNSPAGDLQVHGTEYVPGDWGKMFLQFLDAENRAVNNSECFLTVWYPDDSVFINNSVMSHLDNLQDGIYYENFNVPNITGVYPASAKCYVPLSFNNTIELGNITDGFESGNFTGGYGWSECPPGSVNCTNGWDVEDTVPLATVITNASADGPCYTGNYCARITGSYGFIERGIRLQDGTQRLNITYYFKIKGLQTNEHFDFYVFDGNWHLIDQIGNAVQYGGYTNNVWYKKNVTLYESDFELTTILLGWYATAATPSTNDIFIVDNITIDVVRANITISNETAYQVLRGSGEIHVSKLQSNLLAGMNQSVNPTILSLLEQINRTTNRTGEVVLNNTALLGIVLNNQASIQSSITALSGQVTNLSGQVGNLSTALASNFSSLHDSLEANFTLVHGSIASINTTLSGLRGDLVVMNATLNAINTTTATILGYQPVILTAIANVSVQIVSVQNDLDSLTSDVSDLQNDIDDLTTTLNGVAYNVSNLNLTVVVNLTGIQNGINSLLANCSVLGGNVQSILTTVTTIQTNLTTLLEEEAIEEVTLLGYYTNLSYQISTITGFNETSITELNNSLTALIISETGKPVVYDTSIVLLILYLVLMLLSAYVRKTWYLVMVGFYGTIFGLYLVFTVGFWLGLIITGIGVLYLFSVFRSKDR